MSEGLPLALGEAALTGAPIVCTDVGASLRVLTDPDDGACYSEVVGPNDALSMARAQIKLLALLEEWAAYADNTGLSHEASDSSFPENPTPQDVNRITRRIYEQSSALRRLGMRTRKIVEKSFNGSRYLREHEQMLWIGKAKRDMSLPASSRPSSYIKIPAATFVSDLPRTTVQVPIESPPSAPRGVRESARTSAKESTQNEDYLSSMQHEIASTVLTSAISDMPRLEQAVLKDNLWAHKPQDMVRIVNVQKMSRYSYNGKSPIVESVAV